MVECHTVLPPGADAQDMPPAMRPDSALLKVGQLAPGGAARWDAFVMRCPNATFFHRAGWQHVIEQAFGHQTWFLYAEMDQRIVAVLPLALIDSRLFGRSLSSLPFCVYGGIAGTDPQACAALDQAAQALAGRLGVGHLEYRNRDAAGPYHDPAGWLQKPLYATFRKAIHLDAAQNMLEIPRKQRAMVRKGIAAGLHSAIDYDVQRFYPVYANNLHRLGTPVFGRRYFDLLLREFGRDCDIISVYREQEVLSSVLVFYFRNEVLPYYGAGSASARDVAGNDFMYWEVMRRAGERACTLFDFGRSKLGTGAYDFKKNWGFPAHVLPYQYKLYRAKTLPEVHPLNPRYRHFIRAWRQLPLPLANALGPLIVRNLG